MEETRLEAKLAELMCQQKELVKKTNELHRSMRQEQEGCGTSEQQESDCFILQSGQERWEKNCQRRNKRHMPQQSNMILQIVSCRL